ncbi:hypothetical protein JHL21_00225 [Devosia sp. WQ 349]|uniref:hypothetical protein n=1 Tax=Devosia sp. WQ 349K1 TaxID=2800329 RepID=UPI00190326BE|nr:hypothetical protein [Devosia sp. WQ 349K1]MBK1792918.1 hypothetical protein [Devosia sp. WQ 349K1]
MQSVFIAGSIKIRKMPIAFSQRLETLINSDLHVLVGDANGADKAMQAFLYEKGCENVTVYCSGTAPRNNLGGWQIHNVHTSALPGSRQFFVAKDLAMATKADFGLMLWDAKSTGTLGNVLELVKRGKKSVVYVTTERSFAIVRDGASLRTLVGVMDNDARSQADLKIRISDQIAALNGQPELPF